MLYRFKILIPFVFGFLLVQQTWSQGDIENNFQGTDSLRIMFYNVENLFDPFDDSLTNDDEFTKEGARHWSWTKYQKKLANTYKVIVATGNPLPPALIGLCEIENRFVLNQLVFKTAFAKFDYRIVHQESPDRRGIDVALLFDPKRFILLAHEAIPIHFPFNSQSLTRDILYVKGLVFNSDTVHVFVNHWPSRWGGELATEDKRKYVADLLKAKTDSIFETDRCASIIIMGDFNDEPTNESLYTNLVAHPPGDSTRLVNLMYPIALNKKEGSHKFQGDWAVLDQFIISNCLLKPNNNLKISLGKAFIAKHDFLTVSDEKFLGKKPYRTFNGYEYIGGFSDHFPVYFTLVKVQ
jgi:hypothetical protein